MNKEQEYFLKALAENEDDVATRLVYADWLEENGLDDEADRQRKWSEAKAWLKDFASKCGRTCTNYDEAWDEYLERRDALADEEREHWPDRQQMQEITYEIVVQAGFDYAKEPHNFFVQQGSDEARSVLRNVGRDPFWKNWSIVTGHPIPDWNDEELKWDTTAPFSCSC